MTNKQKIFKFKVLMGSSYVIIKKELLRMYLYKVLPEAELLFFLAEQESL